MYNPVGFRISTCSLLWVYHIVVISYLSTDGNLTCFHSLAMNVGVRNICIHIFEWTNVFNYFECVSRSGIARLYGESMFNFFIWPAAELGHTHSLIIPLSICTSVWNMTLIPVLKKFPHHLSLYPNILFEHLSLSTLFILIFPN